MPIKTRHELRDGKKKCTKCKRWKEVAEFHSRKLRGEPYVTAQCKPCVVRAVQRYYRVRKPEISERRREAYQRDIERYRKYRRDDSNRHAPRREFIAWLKQSPCLDCGGVFNPVCMDFDHLPQHEKGTEVSKMVNGPFSEDELWSEIEKCELICANCHRVRTEKRRTASKLAR